jgi:hypothetical protein
VLTHDPVLLARFPRGDRSARGDCSFNWTARPRGNLSQLSSRTRRGDIVLPVRDRAGSAQPEPHLRGESVLSFRAGTSPQRSAARKPPPLGPAAVRARSTHTPMWRVRRICLRRRGGCVPRARFKRTAYSPAPLSGGPAVRVAGGSCRPPRHSVAFIAAAVTGPTGMPGAGAWPCQQREACVLPPPITLSCGPAAVACGPAAVVRARAAAPILPSTTSPRLRSAQPDLCARRHRALSPQRLPKRRRSRAPLQCRPPAHPARSPPHAVRLDVLLGPRGWKHTLFRCNSAAQNCNYNQRQRCS